MKQKLRDKIEDSYLEFLLNDSNELAKSLLNNYYIAYSGKGIRNRDIYFHDKRLYKFIDRFTALLPSF